MSRERSSLVTRARALTLRAAMTAVTAATVTGTPVPAWGSQPAVEPAGAFLAQQVEPQVVLSPLADESTRLSAKGNDLWEISQLGSFDVPQAALRAYKHAAATVDPSCEMPWTLLAGIGRVES